MYIKTVRKCERASCFDGLLILPLFSLNLLSLVDLVDGQNFASKPFEVARPEETLSDLFGQSFNPKNGTVSGDCQRDSALYRAALRNYTPWALQMYDSSTKIPFGVMTGNSKQLGNYDECLKVQSDYGFVGKACSPKVEFLLNGNDDNEIGNDGPDLRAFLLNMALASGLKNWSFTESVPYEWLWCVPSSCSPLDVAETIEIGMEPLKRSAKLQFIVTVGNDSCQTESSNRAIFATTDWIYISVLLIFGIIIVISTIYDLLRQRISIKTDLKGTTHKILTCFSMYTNGKSLCSIQRNADSIACFDGLRFLSMCWVIYSHTVHLNINGIVLDLSEISRMHERWNTLLYLNDNIVTDTFFLLSGTLMTYSEMARKEKNPESYKFNIWKLYLRRYLRLTSSYALMIGFYAILFYKIGTGPRWNDHVGVQSHYCVENWWTNLLYVNNYVNLPSACLAHTWYLAIDMQMVWLSPIFLYPMLSKSKRMQKIGLFLLAAAIVASILAPFLITYWDRLTGTLIFYKDMTDLTNVYVEVYTRVYTRAGPYLVGLGLGHFLRCFKHRKTTMPRGLVICGWTIAIATTLAVLLGPRKFYFRNQEYNAVESAFYAGFHRQVFVLGVAWIVVACVFGCAGPVGALLSWSAWVPLSKLCYSIFLTHHAVIIYAIASRRTPWHYTIFHSVHMFFGDLLMSLFPSVLLYLCIEVPFCRLDQLLTSRNKSTCTRQPLKENESSQYHAMVTSTTLEKII